MTFKQRLKQNKLLYYLRHKILKAQQDRFIYREQVRYERIAAEQGISSKEDTKAVFYRLRERLKKREISWPPVNHNRPLHILYASLPGNWERHNIPPELEKIGKVSYFYLREQDLPFNEGWAAIRSRVDTLLLEYIKKLHAESHIDIFLSYLSGSQVSAKTIERVNQLGIPTFSFHLDDRLYFRGNKYGDQWSGPFSVCNSYDLNLTNARASLIKYRCEGANALFWPEGANPAFFRPLDIPFNYDVTFCGARYGQRPLLVNYLRKCGIKVDCFGKDWEHGYQADEELVRIFNSSRINLGLGYVTESSDQCLKGRDFEVPACGALYLTSHNSDIERVYRIGNEIETYTSFEDCASKIKELLADPNRCSRIRFSARQAVLKRHTWEFRFKQLLECLDLPE